MSSLALAGALVLPVGVAPALASGQFEPYAEIPIPSGVHAVAIGDLSGDGRDDVALTSGYAGNPDTDVSVFVLLQGADGMLGAPVRYATAGHYAARAESLDIGDIDGDGIADVVVGIDRMGIQVFPGTGGGALGTPYLSPHANSTWVRVGQFDGRGGLDVAGIGWGSNTVTIFTDPGGGLDGIAQYPAIHNGWDDLEVGDVNGDGHQDIVVMSGQGLGPNVSIVPGRGDGTFGATVAHSVYDQVLTRGIGIGDTNGDGRTDIAASYGGNSPDGRVALWVQLADGGLDLPVIHGSYDIPSPVEIADFDHDGRGDVVTVHAGWLQTGVYFGRESGTLGQEQLYPMPSMPHSGAHSLAVGDINGDGWADIVAGDSVDGLVILENSQESQPTEPGAPTLTSAVPGDGLATLQWAGPVDDGGAPITSFYAEAAPGGAYCLVSQLGCQISGLTNGTNYSFTVRAGNETGLGPPSNVLSAMPGVAPGVPRSLAASPNLQAGIGLSWQAPISLGSPSLSGYRIYRGVSGGALTLHATVNSNAVAFTDTTVVNGGSYTYQLTAFSTIGEGPRTSVVAAQRGTAPSAPRTLAASVAPKAINLTWTAPSTDGGSAVTGYRIYRGTTSANKVQIGTVIGTTLAYADKALVKKTKYFYWVTAVSVLGESLPSNEVTATSR